MPRGVKRARNFDDEITKITAQINQHEAIIKTLKSQLHSLSGEKEQQDLKSLNRLIRESGLSVGEITELLAGREPQ